MVRGLAIYARALFSPVHVSAWAFLSLAFIIVGPFGTYEELGMIDRALLWSVSIACAIALAIGIRLAVEAFRPDMSFVQASATAAFPTSGVMAWIMRPAMQDGFNIPADLAPGPLEIFLLTLVLAFAVISIQMHTRKGDQRDSDIQRSRLLRRLEPKLDGEILHLSVDDHYVDVATSKGTGRILMRFSDAIEEVAPAIGMQVHRSHWVAHEAISDVVREGGRTFVVLVNGARVPVSRAYQAAVEGFTLASGRA